MSDSDANQNLIDDLQIRPLFSGAAKGIHPAIGVMGNIAYVGVWIPGEVRSLKAGKTAEKDILFLITSNHEIIPAENEKLQSRGWRLKYKSIQILSEFERWPLSDIQCFLGEMDDAPIDSIGVYKDVDSAYVEFLEFTDPAGYVLNAVWDIGTYFAHLFNSYPYFYLGGTKGSGKTKNIQLSMQISHNGIQSGNMSTPTIYRLIQNQRCTLGIDETENLGMNRYRQVSERALDFRNILLNGYKKGSPAYRIEKTSKEKMVPEAYEVYGPKRIANIGGIDDVLEDRCVVNFMVTAKPGPRKDSDIDLLDPRWPELRCKLYRLYLNYWHEVKLCYDELTLLAKSHGLVHWLKEVAHDANEEDLEKIGGRQLEIWKPLLAMARFFDLKDPSGELQLTRTMISAAIRNVNEKIGENLTETGDMILLETLTTMVTEEDWHDDYISSSDIHKKMVDHFEEEQKWLSTDWVGRALRRLQFRDKRRLGRTRQTRIIKADVLDLAERYNIKQAESDGYSTTASQVSKEAQVAQPKTTSDTSDASDAFPETSTITQELIQSVLATFTKLEKESETGEIEEQFLVRNITNDQHLTTVDRAKQVITNLVQEGLLFYSRLEFLRRTAH
ncbi:MAG: hypothetical protein ABSA92_13950 [Candidatus Bathyarchaeia archaeon]|jgi:oligoribonuclease NrnB/cAMP/cGMP phosphodiesterase (DHH superfamily)